MANRATCREHSGPSDHRQRGTPASLLLDALCPFGIRRGAVGAKDCDWHTGCRHAYTRLVCRALYVRGKAFDIAQLLPLVSIRGVQPELYSRNVSRTVLRLVF